MSAVSLLRTPPDPGPAPGPAAAGGETLALILALTRLRAQRLALVMERRWRAGATSPDQGLAITAGEVAWLLAAEDSDRQDAAFLSADPRGVALTEAIRLTGAALAADGAWRAVAETFALAPAQADFLALLAAVEADPGLKRVMAYLNDDARQDEATPQLSRRLAGTPRAPWRPGALARWRLAEPALGAPPHALTTPWRADPAVLAALAEGGWRDPVLGEAVRVVPPQKARAALVLHPAALAALEASPEPWAVELAGPRGVGRETVAAQYAAARGQALVSLDAAALTAQGLDGREVVLRGLRQAKALGALAYFRDAETVPAGAWDLARSLATPFLRGVRQGGAHDGGAHDGGGAGSVTLTLEPPAIGERRALWALWSAAPPPQALATHRLTPAEIRRLAMAPGPTDGAGGHPRPSHDLLELLACPYDWDELVLPAEVERALRDFADQIRLRWSVYDDWGFGRLTHLGFGVAALFAGPSGTGKTMAAQVIARALGLDLYRVDLAGVVNKYVGETEKRLREVFDACEHAGALLFFDEADALFGARLQAKDAHDRFANIETNYLLQRIETFDGVAILATNRRNDLDQAFLRRLRFIVEFLPPRPQERLALWRRALHPTSPAGEPLLAEIDFPLLAERLQMTGAEIKNTVLAAAFLAKAQGQRIGMGQLLAAAERELAKQRAHLPASLREGTPR